MSEEQKHTETPWKAQDGPNKGDPIRWITGAGFEPVCDFYSRDRDEAGELLLHPFHNAKANAEFIVKAVNSYKGMLDVFREIINKPDASFCSCGKLAHKGIAIAKGGQA